MKKRWILIALLTLPGGCSDWSASSRYAVALEAASFIRAARSHDRASFDAYIDWPAVQSDIQQQLEDAKGAGGALLAAEDDRSGGLGDGMVRPSDLHFKAPPGAYGGMLGAAHLALRVRSAEDGRLCLTKDIWTKTCVLTFAREGARWKIVGMSLDLFRPDDSPSWSV